MPASICPHCNKPGISMLRRAFLGPVIPATCSACGLKVGVPYGKSLLACCPIILLPLLWRLPGVREAALPVAALVVPLSLWMFIRWVPLIKK